MSLDDRRHVHRHDPAILHDDPAIHDRVAGLLRGAEHGCRYRIIQRARVVHRIEVYAEEVRPHSGREMSDIVAPELDCNAPRPVRFRTPFDSFSMKRPAATRPIVKEFSASSR